MDNITALINHHSSPSYRVPASSEVSSFALLEERRLAAQVRFDAIGLPRDEVLTWKGQI
jgi:hypothetical protein